LAARLVHEAELDGVVAVAFLVANEQDGAGPEFEDGDGVHLALVVVDLRHADLLTEQSQRHVETLLCSEATVWPGHAWRPGEHHCLWPESSISHAGGKVSWYTFRLGCPGVTVREAFHRLAATRSGARPRSASRRG